MTMNSTRDVRNFLLKQMDKVADGTADMNATKGIANLAQQVYNTVNLELKVAHAKAKLGDDMKILAVKFGGDEASEDSGSVQKD